MKEYLKGFTRVASLFVLGVALIAVYKTFDNINIIFDFCGRIVRILSPFVVGLGIAFLLYAPASRLEKRLQRLLPPRIVRFSRSISVLLVYLILILAITLLLFFGLPALVRSTLDFVGSLPKYYRELMEFLNSLTEKDGLLEGFSIAEAVENIYTSYIEPKFTAEAVISYFTGIMNFTTSLLNVFMSFIISIYMLLSRDSLIKTGKIILGLFLHERQLEGLSHYTHRSCEILYSYFYSQALDGLIVAIIMTIGLESSAPQTR